MITPDVVGLRLALFDRHLTGICTCTAQVVSPKHCEFGGHWQVDVALSCRTYLRADDQVFRCESGVNHV
jgi:hypothetical protein